ncbi:DUF6387 family protein [Marinobacterium sp. YM272]|uniref:DUF6387 family protein n=1 Tax=Marinobacterium sp. YM272 TaxID=3421654 RepID=UPI003D7F3AE0
MKRKEILRALSWFDITNYEPLMDLQLPDFLDQFYWRAVNFTSEGDWDDWDEYEAQKHYDCIVTGTTILAGIEFDPTPWTACCGLKLGQYPDGNCDQHLASTAALKTLNLNDLSLAYETLKSAGYYDGERAENSISIGAPSVSTINVGYFSDDVWLSVNILEYTDDEIIEGIRQTLPKWRRQKGMPNRAGDIAMRSSMVTIKKLVNYRVIPILDILLWARYRKVKVWPALLSRVVWDGADGVIKTVDHLRDTIMPFVYNIATWESWQDLQGLVRKEPSLRDLTMKDII